MDLLKPNTRFTWFCVSIAVVAARPVSADEPKLLRRILEPSRCISLALSSTAHIIAIGTGAPQYRDNAPIELWDIASGKKSGVLDGRVRMAPFLAFSPDGGMLASSHNDGTVRLWDVSMCRRVTVVHIYNCTPPVFTRKGQGLLWADNAKAVANGEIGGLAGYTTIRLWDIARGQSTAVLKLTALGGRLPSWANFSPDSATVGAIVGSLPLNTLKLWDLRTGRNTVTLKGHSAMIWDFMFSPDGRMLATTSPDQTIRLWSTANGKNITTWNIRPNIYSRVVFHPSGKILAWLADVDKQIRFRDVVSGKDIASIDIGPEECGYVFSTDGRTFVEASCDGKINVWDTAMLHNERVIESPSRHRKGGLSKKPSG